MPCWYYDKKELKNSPSFQEGLDYETECRYRREGARFIIDMGSKMGLRYDTMATGVVYFHRFYMFHTFKDFPRYVTACCALFLAGKVEETPKKCKDIIKTARSLLNDHKFTQFGDDPKEEVMTLERILLQTIRFDLQVEHPYSYLLKYAKSLKGDKNKLQKMVQMAWTFVNDSLCTTLCLQWEPEILAISLMYLAGKLNRFEVVDWVGRLPKHLRWWDMFVEDITMDLLEDICHQVLDLYSQPQMTFPSDSPPPQTPGGGPLAPPNLAAIRLRANSSSNSPSTPGVPKSESKPPQEITDVVMTDAVNRDVPPAPMPPAPMPANSMAVPNFTSYVPTAHPPPPPLPPPPYGYPPPPPAPAMTYQYYAPPPPGPGNLSQVYSQPPPPIPTYAPPPHPPPMVPQQNNRPYYPPPPSS